MAVPVAPTITKVLWATTPVGSLTGTAEKFTILLEWTNAFDADYYDIDFDGGTGSGLAESTSVTPNGATVVWWATYDGDLGAGAEVAINGHNGDGDGAATTIALTPTTISGDDEISANLSGNVFHPLTIGPSKPTDWAWTIAGAPSGITISEKTDTQDGGTIIGSPAAEGVFNITVGLTNYGASSNILYAQNYPVTLRVSGERYIEDFHEDASRTAVNVRYPKGTVASWNTNTAGELELMLGDSFTLHAILRNGTGYLSTGVTNLRFIAKLPGRVDGPAILSATAASPTVGTFGTVSAWPVTLAVDSTLARQLFDVANSPEGASTDATAGLLLTGNISYAYGGRTYYSDAFAVRLKQPVSQF
jgi:hypothetical protein